MGLGFRVLKIETRPQGFGFRVYGFGLGFVQIQVRAKAKGFELRV